MAQAIRTTDHEVIREWVEERGGSPAVIEGTSDGFGSGILRVDFGLMEEPLQEVNWEEFFRIFDENDLAFEYETDESGAESYTCRFVARHADPADPLMDEGEELGDVTDAL
jgi:hypothetical protein